MGVAQRREFKEGRSHRQCQMEERRSQAEGFSNQEVHGDVQELFPRAPDGRVTKARGEGRGNTGWMKCMLF